MINIQMMQMLNLDKLNDHWFFSKVNPVFKIIQIYIKSDSLVILPLWIFIIITGLFSWKFMLIEIGIFFTLRGIGEMISWLNTTFIPAPDKMQVKLGGSRMRTVNSVKWHYISRMGTL